MKLTGFYFHEFHEFHEFSGDISQKLNFAKIISCKKKNKWKFIQFLYITELFLLNWLQTISHPSSLQNEQCLGFLCKFVSLEETIWKYWKTKYWKIKQIPMKILMMIITVMLIIMKIIITTMVVGTNATSKLVISVPYTWLWKWLPGHWDRS